MAGVDLRSRLDALTRSTMQAMRDSVHHGHGRQ